MKREDYSPRSSFQRKPVTRKSNSNFNSSSPYDDSFTQIPRVVEDSYEDFFGSRTQGKNERFFEPAQSEEEYGNLFPTSRRKSTKADKLKMSGEYNQKVWNFFTGLNEGSSENEKDSDEKSNTFSFNSRKSSQNGRNDVIEPVPHSVSVEQQSASRDKMSSTSKSSKTQEVKNQQKPRQLKIHLLKTASKEFDITIKPMSLNLPQAKIKKSYQRLFNSSHFHEKKRFETSEQKVERVFVMLSEQNFEERNSPHALRRTRMRPLRYWLGERIIYGKEGAKGKVIVKQ